MRPAPHVGRCGCNHLWLRRRVCYAAHPEGGSDAHSGFGGFGDSYGFDGGPGSGPQTYNPDYPVCLQVFGRETNYIECAYTSLAQCAQSASGRPAMCVINPFPGPRECPRNEITGGIAASTKAYSGTDRNLRLPGALSLGLPRSPRFAVVFCLI